MDEEQEEEKDFDSVDEHKDQVDSLGSDPSFGEINRGKNLRDLLTNIKKKETPSFKSKSELGSEIDVESNSDTFGQTHKSRISIIRKRQPIRLSDNKSSIKEIPKMEDELSQNSEESENNLEEIKDSNELSLPSKLHKISNENAYEKLQKTISQ